MVTFFRLLRRTIRIITTNTESDIKGTMTVTKTTATTSLDELLAVGMGLVAGVDVGVGESNPRYEGNILFSAASL